MKWLLANKWTRGAAHVCYPMGSFDDELLSILPQIGVKSGRTTIFGTQAEPVEDMYRLKCIAVGRDTDINFIKDNILKATQTGNDVFFMFHNVVKTPDPKLAGEAIFVSTDKFIEILNYVESLRNANLLKVSTVSKWYDNYIKENPR